MATDDQLTDKGKLALDLITRLRLRAVCAAIPTQDLRAVIAVHRANCHQAGCLVLAMMVARAEAMEARGGGSTS